jgi:hypothetical protein
MAVPTNDELFENAPDTVEQAIRLWLLRHVKPLGGGFWSTEGLEWASKNLINDPEIRGAMKKEFGIE